MKRRRKNSGFTLIELLIGILMSAFIMSAISIVVVTAMKGYELSNEATEQTNLIRNTLERIARDIRSADYVDWPVGQPMVINPGTSQIVYSVNNGRLIYTKNGTSTTLLGPDDKISVTKIDGQVTNDAAASKTLLVTAAITYVNMDGATVSVNISASPRKNHIK